MNAGVSIQVKTQNNGRPERGVFLSRQRSHFHLVRFMGGEFEMWMIVRKREVDSGNTSALSESKALHDFAKAVEVFDVLAARDLELKIRHFTAVILTLESMRDAQL